MDAGAVQLELVLTGYKETERQLKALAEKAAKVKAQLRQDRNNKRVVFTVKGYKVTYGQIKKFQAAVKGAATTAKKAGEQIKKAGQSMREGLNSSLANVAGLGALTAALISAGRAAIKFEKVQRKLNMTLGAEAAGVLKFTTQLAEQYGLGINATADSFGSFTAAASRANISLETQKNLFASLAKTSVAFGLSQQQSQLAFYAVQQMASKGVVSMEELRRQLGEQIPIASAAMARGLGISIRELYRLVESGQLAASEALPALANGMEVFTGDLPDVAATKIGRLSTAIEGLQIAVGEEAIPFVIPWIEQATEGINRIGELKAAIQLDPAGMAGKYISQMAFPISPFGDTQKTLGLGLGEGGIKAAQDALIIADQFDTLGVSVERVIEVYKQVRKETGADLGSWEAFEKTTAELEKQTGAQKEAVNAAKAMRLADEAAAKTEEDLAKALSLETSHLADKLKIENKLQKLRDSSKSREVSQLVGDEAGQAFDSIAGLKAAMAAEKQAQAELRAAMTAYDTKNKDEKTEKARQNQELAAEKVRLAFKDAGLSIQDAFDNAKRSAEDAAKSVRKAAMSYADILASGDKGISSLQRGRFKTGREDAGRSLQVAQALKARNLAINEIQKTQGNFARFDFERQYSDSRIQGMSSEQLTRFTQAIDTEINAQDVLKKSNEDLSKANNNLAGVMQIAADNGIKINENSAALVTSLSDLVNKDWSVVVNVPGATTSGDAIQVQNALS